MTLWSEETASISEFVNDLQSSAGFTWTDYQWEAYAGMAAQAAPLRACLYYKTGAGKTITALVGALQSGHTHAVVVAPPSTHDSWQAQAQRLGMTVECISHAKFRMPDYRLLRDRAVIADEFHLFGGHGGKGWKKLDRLARGLQAPLILCSATPNYNDAERVYCIQHILEPHKLKGGYLEFLYRTCETEQDPFSQTPKVLGFLHHKDAAEYLAALEHVYYLPDDLVYTINDIGLPHLIEAAFMTYGYDQRSGRMVASIIEEKHKLIFNTLTEQQGQFNVIRSDTYDQLTDLVGSSTTPVLVFAAHSSIANALGNNLYAQKVKHAVVTGQTPAKKKKAYIDAFRDGVLDVLVGTASLATGTDGLDKVCDCLIILDDTDDDSLRRQLIGRIMPRGLDTDASRKQVHRFLLP